MFLVVLFLMLSVLIRYNDKATVSASMSNHRPYVYHCAVSCRLWQNMSK